jgi:hypothetical protein
MEKAYQDPQTALSRVLEEESQWEKAEAEVLQEKERIQARKAALQHQLAADLIMDLFDNLDQFAAEFTSGPLFKRYQGLLRHVDAIRVHDPAFPRTLAAGNYQIESEYFDYWLNKLERFLAAGEPLDRFLSAALTKTHGSPFEPKQEE